MGHEPLGAEHSNPRGMVPDLGGRNRGAVIPYRSRNLRAVFRPRGGICGHGVGGARGRTAPACSQTFADGAVVSLDYGRGDVYPALYGIFAQARCAVQLGDLSLDRRYRADDIDRLSRNSRLILDELLGDLAGQSRPGGRLEKSAAIHGPPCAAAAEIREISVGEQAVPWRDYRDWVVGDWHRRVHDVPGPHDFLPAQPVSVQRYDVGTDVCAPRTGR